MQGTTFFGTLHWPAGADDMGHFAVSFLGLTSYEMIRQRTRSTSSQFLTSSLFRTSTSGKVDHTVTDMERKKVIKNITLRINSKRSVRNENS